MSDYLKTFYITLLAPQLHSSAPDLWTYFSLQKSKPFLKLEKIR